MTQTLIIRVIRTNKIPFIQSRTSWPLVAATVPVIGIALRGCPCHDQAPVLRFVTFPAAYWPLLGLTLLCYVELTQLVKLWPAHRRWI